MCPHIPTVKPFNENNPIGTLREGVIIIEDQNITSSEESNVEASTEDQQTSEVDSQEAEPVVTDNSQPDGGEDSFFDPNSVPEELKPAYKQMQSAFTKKTQEIAQARKEAEEVRQKADAYEKYSQYVPLLDEMIANRGSNANQETPEMQALTQKLRDAGYDDSAIDLMKVGAQFTLDQFNKFNQSQEAEKHIAFVESKISEAAKLDPRLNDQSLVYEVDGDKLTFGQIVEQYVSADPNWESDPIKATQKALKTVDALIGKAKTVGKQELSASAQKKAAKFPQVSSSPQGAVDSSQPLSITEAVKQAQQELAN